MWQRFTERARRAVFFAQEEAARFGQSNVGPEHLVLGLVRNSDSVAARILNRMGVSLGRIRSEIERQVTPGKEPPGQEMQLTPRAKRVIDLAYAEARLLNNNYIGTEHLLLGLLRESELSEGLTVRVFILLKIIRKDEGLSGCVLRNAGAELKQIREETKKLQGQWNDLLRPAMATPERHEEQLLRASGKQE